MAKSRNQVDMMNIQSGSVHITDRNGNLYELKVPFRGQVSKRLSQNGENASNSSGKKFRFRQQHTTATFNANYEHEISNLIRDTRKDISAGRKFMLSFGMPSAEVTAAP